MTISGQNNKKNTRWKNTKKWKMQGSKLLITFSFSWVQNLKIVNYKKMHELKFLKLDLKKWR